MGIGVTGPKITQKNIKQSMKQQYPHPTRWEKMMLEILYVYGARAIFLLFCYHQDTKSE